MNYDHNNGQIDDYYAFLNVPRNASLDDIRNAFRLFSRQFHPDKHTNPALKQQAELMFDKLKKVYDVLSDPDKRAVYDALGASGLQNNEAWALVEKKFKSFKEIREEYEQLMKEKEERLMQQRTSPKGNITVLVDATNLFQQDDDDGDDDDRRVVISPSSIEVRSMTITQSLDSPLTLNNHVILNGMINVRNGVGSGNLALGFRHIFNPKTWGEIEFGAGQGPMLNLKGFRTITPNLHATCNTNLLISSYGIRPGLSLTLTRQFSKHFIGHLSYKAGLDSSMNTTMAFENEYCRINGSLQFGYRNSFISSSYTHKFKQNNTRVKVGLKFGIVGVMLDYGCETRLSQYSTLGAAMTVGTIAGVNLRIKLIRNQQTYMLPILLSEEVVPASLLYGTILPLITYYLIKNYIIDVYLKKIEQEELEKEKEANASLLQQRRQEARAYIELMKDFYRRIIEREQSVDGLIIEKALYGEESDVEQCDHYNGTTLAAESNVFDFQVALQVLVNEDSRLILTSASKSYLPGFFDTNLGRRKKLLIRYRYKSRDYRPITCKAAILYEEGKPMVIEEVIIPAPDDDQVRVKMISAGICASDGHYVWGQQKLRDLFHELPTVLGHEGAGIVESVGRNVTDLKPGDHVLTTFAPNCQECSQCAVPSNNMCLKFAFNVTGCRPTRKLAKNGENIYGVSGTGTFSEYITVYRPQAIKIKQTDNLANLCVISCAAATGFYSAVHRANVQPNSTCAVWGMGGIGLNTLQGCRYNKAKNIIAIDINPNKRDIAMQFGATEFLNPKELDKPVEQFLMEKFVGGIDYAFDCFGSQVIVDQAINSLAMSGTFTMVGVTSADVILKYPAIMLLFGRTITGCLLGAKKAHLAYPEMPIKCRAAVLYKEGDPLVIEDVIVPIPDADQVRVRMLAVGICATDAHFAWGTAKMQSWGHKLPSVLGHEGTGIVESIGSNVNDFRVGDVVLMSIIPQCKECTLCRNPNTNICRKNLLPDLGSRVSKKLVKSGQELYGIMGLGTFSDYITVNRDQLFKITAEVNFENAAIISCAVATGFYSAVNLAKVLPGSSCAVWGIGSVGLNVLQGCEYREAKNIIAIDITSSKKEIAIEFGATEFVNPKQLNGQTLEHYLLEKYGGIDYAFDCFGSKITIDQALKSLSVTGTFVLVGVPPDDTNIVYPCNQLMTGRTITAGFVGGKKSEQAYSELMEMYRTKRIKIDEMITEKIALDKINEGFENLRSGKVVRSLVTFENVEMN
ncbi:DnaJ-like protein [Euroglyphus maynei]|uniref:Alcohol dehydrogenase 6 n=1 Tax=Euroglyphus maynei TaxID=6958 RepID=A0A1Y3AYS6_EURMA|nr:DnaJ-like protein [Euroglyphus maynei]